MMLLPHLSWCMHASGLRTGFPAMPQCNKMERLKDPCTTLKFWWICLKEGKAATPEHNRMESNWKDRKIFLPSAAEELQTSIQLNMPKRKERVATLCEH